MSPLEQIDLLNNDLRLCQSLADVLYVASTSKQATLDQKSVLEVSHHLYTLQTRCIQRFDQLTNTPAFTKQCEDTSCT
jgi:hypothetical protein